MPLRRAELSRSCAWPIITPMKRLRDQGTMGKKIITARSADGAAAPAVSDAPPGTIANAGANGAWDGVVVEQHRTRDFELPESTVSTHLVCLRLGPPRMLHWQAGDGGRGSRIMSRGDSTFVPAGAPRALRSEGDSEILLISLEPDLVSRAVRGLAREGAIEFPAWSAGRDPQVEHLGLALMAETDGPGRFADQFYAETLAHALSVHLVRRYCVADATRVVAPGGLGSRGLRLVTDYVGDNLRGDLSLRGIAREVGRSPYGVARAFKRSTGLTLHRYVTERRLELAKSLLAGTDLSVGEVCRRVGLTSQSHFTRLFRNYVGTTPTAYRKSRAGAPSSSTSPNRRASHDPDEPDRPLTR